MQKYAFSRRFLVFSPWFVLLPYWKETKSTNSTKRQIGRLPKDQIHQHCTCGRARAKYWRQMLR